MDDSTPDGGPEPTPDGVFAAAGLALGEAILVALPQWAERIVVARTDTTQADEGRAAGERMAEALAEPLARLLSADMDEQRGTPLTLLRSAHRPLTDLLAARGVPYAVRDDADRAANPDDVFAVAPRSFGDLGEVVHDAGLRWGVAKAFAHRARHRDSSPGSPGSPGSPEVEGLR